MQILKNNKNGLYKMSISENLGLLYYLIPFIFVAKNKISLSLSVIFGASTYKIKLNDVVVKFHSSKFDVMLAFLAILTYAHSYSIKPDNKIEVIFGRRSKFIIPLHNMSFEDENLILTLFGGLRHGADFVTTDEDFKNRRDKTYKITEINGKKIIETSKGIKFYMDSIHPGNTIVASYVQDIHLVNSNDDFHNKIVIDVGPECGDTPLYYANLGATVYAFEPIKAHFDAMVRNIALNPKLADKIIPVNAAIGNDGMLTFYQNTRADIAEMASYVYNIHKKNMKTSQVKGYSFRSVLKEFNIKHVDLFKIDCKGCEFELTGDVLENVDRVKISNTYDESPDRRQEKLIDMLENAGFQCVAYRVNPNRDKHSIRLSAQIFGIKVRK